MRLDRAVFLSTSGVRAGRGKMAVSNVHSKVGFTSFSRLATVQSTISQMIGGVTYFLLM